MKTLAAGTITALSQPVVPIVQLVYLGFASPIALNTSTWDIVHEGVTYRGAYGLGSISAVADSPGEIKGLQFTMSGVSAASISLALDGGDVWQGTPITIRTAILDANYAVTEAPVEWTGRGDVMAVSEDGDTCTVTATAESTAVDLLRGSAMTYSDGDQQSLYPGDRAFEYVVDQANKPIVWPSKEYFQK
jgi:hypothetical protein